MTSRHILILGATGMLGQPVTHCLLEKGHRVRILVRNVEKAHRMFGGKVEFVEGSALDRSKIEVAIRGCDAVHFNLTQESELIAMQHIIALEPRNNLERISFVSSTTVCEENRWFELVDVKMRTEKMLRHSGIAHTIFCPTWAMETLHNFIHGDWAAVIVGKNPPPLHFFASVDFGRMVANSFDDERVLGKRLFIHGSDGYTLPEALGQFINACHPELKLRRMKLWQAQLIARLAGREGLTYVTQLIAYFDKVKEFGNPSEANELLGAPSITLEEWFKMPKEGHGGIPY